MIKYIIKRVLVSIGILLVVMFTFYLIMRALPASYVEKMARELATKPGSKPYLEWVAQLNAMYGLDKDVFSGYFIWLQSAAVGDFGDSWQYTVPVMEKFNSVIWYSFALGAVALVLQVLIAIPLGIVAAQKQYSLTDYSVTVFSLIGISLPTFFIATILKLVFSVKLQWFPLLGTVSPGGPADPTFWQVFVDTAWHFVLPLITILAVSIGGLMRYTRTNMLEVLNSDFIRTARAKGLPEHKVIYRHAFRNTLIPVITMVGGMLPGLFAGAMITETLFKIEGIGYSSYVAIMNGDIPFTMFYLSFLAILTLAGNLLSDILYAVVDPRVRVGG